MTQQEEILALRTLIEKQKEELEEKDRVIEEQNARIEKQNIQIENMIQALLHARKKAVRTFYRNDKTGGGAAVPF